MRDETQAKIGGYQILREIGRGGMGVVYEARKFSDQSLCALKVLSPSRSGDEDAVRRFLREGAIAQRLRHPNIVKIHEVGQDDDLCFIAMELHLGPSLEDLVFELRRGRDEALQFFLGNDVEIVGPAQESEIYQRSIAQALAQVSKAVEYAHQQGLIHRDIKPGNILIGGPGRLLLTDFGLVRELDSDTQTLTGDLLGTPLYMSPEQIMGRRDLVGPRSDVYALGATLHESLGLQAPYSAQDITRLARQIEADEPRDLASLNPSLPRMLVTITRRAMSKRPEDRYAGAALFADDLERFVAGRSIVARPPDALEQVRNLLRRRPDLVAVVATLLITAVVISGFFFWRDLSARQRRDEDAQRVFSDGRAQLNQGSFRAAWSAAAEAESLSPDAIYAVTLREDVESAFVRDFQGRMMSGLEGLLRTESMLQVLIDLPGHQIDLESLLERRLQQQKRVLAMGASLEDEKLDEVFLSFAKNSAADLEALRRELAPTFTRVFSEKMGRFNFAEASRLAQRARDWGVVLAPTSGVPDEAEDLTRPGHLELQGLATDLFGEDPGLRRRALAKLSDPINFVRLPWLETQRMILRFVQKIDDATDAREFIRMVDRLALPGFGAELVNLVQKYPHLSRSLIEMAGRHPDPALTEYLLGVHTNSGSMGMEAALIGALRAADMNDILQLARQLEAPQNLDPESLRLLLFVLDRRELSDLDTRLDSLIVRLKQDLPRLPAVLEVMARRGRSLDPDLTFSVLARVPTETQVSLLAALPEAALNSYAKAKFESGAAEEMQVVTSALLAAPEKAKDLLLKILDHSQSDLQLRALALYSLGALGDPAVELRLVQAITSSQSLLRRSALSGLARPDGSDRRGGRFSAMFEVARKSLMQERSLEVRAAAVDLIASLSAHELAPELTGILENWQPDTAEDLLTRLVGHANVGGEISRIIETFGLTPLARASQPREANSEVLALALVRALGRLGLDSGWDDEESRTRAAEALLDISVREDISTELARAAWESLDSFRYHLDLEDLVILARGISRAEVAAAAGRCLIQREAGEAATELLQELPVRSASSRAVAAIGFLEQGLILKLEEELVRAWVSGFRDMEALGARNSLQAAYISSTVKEIDRRLRTERLVD